MDNKYKYYIYGLGGAVLVWFYFKNKYTPQGRVRESVPNG